MTTATVYHAREPNFGFGAPAPFDAANYRRSDPPDGESG